MRRTQYLSDRYRLALPEALARADAGRRPQQDPDSLWTEVVGLDPSRHKRYLGWICDQIAASQLKSEDFYKMPLALAELDRARPMMRRAGVSCDIGQYDSLPALNAALMRFEGQATPAELDAAERAAIDAETVVHVRNEHLLIVEPKTERSSCFWGRGTKWCTAATESRNRFADYAKDGYRLLIFILPDGTRYQGCTNGEFADAADEDLSESGPPVDLAAAIRDEESAVTLMQLMGRWLDQVPVPLQTERVRESAVTQDGRALKFIPVDQQTERVREIAVTDDGAVLVFIPADQQTEHVREIAVAQNGWALKFIPADQQTERVREIAVAQSGLALKFIPSDQQTEHVREIAVAQNGRALEFIPADHQTERVREIAVVQGSRALQFIPADQQIEHVREVAVAQDGMALQFIPAELQTERIRQIAVAETGWALRFIPADQQTERVRELAVAQNGWVLESVPLDQQTDRLKAIARREIKIDLPKYVISIPGVSDDAEAPLGAAA